MKNKKLIAILTLLCFLFTFMPVVVFAEADSYVAEVNEIKYTDLQDAIDAAPSGGTVTLLSDINYVEGHTFKNDYVVIDKSLTLELGNFTITNTIDNFTCPFPDNPYGFKNYPAALYVRNGSIGTEEAPGYINVVINATNGGIIARGEDKVAIVSGNIQKTDAETDASDGRKTNLTINGGNYAGERYCIFHNNGLLTINGGTYQDNYTGAEPQHLLYAHRYDYFAGDFVINGGSFKGFNPACAYMHGGEYSAIYGSAKHWHGYVPEGKTGVLGDDGWYTVADGSRVLQRTSTIASTSSNFVCHCYASLQDAVDAGETNVTLLADSSENFAAKNDLTLNLGSFTMTGTIGVADDAFTATGTEEHQSCKIEGPTITIKADDKNASVLLAAPRLDHHTFLGWCNGTDSTNPTYANKNGENWTALVGQAYHAHWQHSNYTELGSALHHDFTMNYAGGAPENYELTFELEEGTGSINGVEDGDYFSATVDGLKVTITPKELVEQLDAGTYTDEIHVTTGDGATHTIHAKLIVEKVNSEVSSGTDSETYSYGDTITLTATVTKANNDIMMADLDEPELDTVAFYCGTTLLGNAVVEYEENTFPQQGTATLKYDTTLNKLVLGTNQITAIYGGSVNLNGSKSDTITITLEKKELAANDTFEFGENIITGPAIIGPDEVTVKGGGSINDAEIPAGTTVTVPANELDKVTTNANGTVLPAGSSITSGDITIEVEDGNVTVDNEGNIIVDKDSTVKVNDTTITGPASVTENGDVKVEGGGSINGAEISADTTVTVPSDKIDEVTSSDGTISLPAGSTITNSDTTVEVEDGNVIVDDKGNIIVDEDSTVKINDTTITGPASVTDDGDVKVETGGSITSSNETIKVESGNVTVDDEGNIIVDKDSTVKVNDTTITGPASVTEDGDVKVEAGGKIDNGQGGSYIVPEGTTIIIPESKLDEVTTDENGTVNVPAGTVMEKEDGTKQEFQYGGTITTDGTVKANPKPSSGGGFSGTYNYPVSVPSADNGKVTLSDNNASAGETVVITTTPNNGYGVAEVIVTDAKGNVIPVTNLGGGKYSFVMPAGKVSVTAEFKPAITLTVGSTTANVFGKTVKNDVAPIIVDGRTMLPIRFIAEALDGTVTWNEATQTVTITKDGVKVQIIIGADYAYINGEKVKLDAPAFIDNSRTYLPVRFVSEALGATVNWDAVTRQVVIMK